VSHPDRGTVGGGGREIGGDWRRERRGGDNTSEEACSALVFVGVYYALRDGRILVGLHPRLDRIYTKSTQHVKIPNIPNGNLLD
jgi:hypothetical protein